VYLKITPMHYASLVDMAWFWSFTIEFPSSAFLRTFITAGVLSQGCPYPTRGWEPKCVVLWISSIQIVLIATPLEV